MREITYAQAICEAMSEEMRRDPKVFFMGEDVGAYGGAFGVSAGMFNEFGKERVRDTPISEAAIMGAAVGAAMTGMRPIIEIMFSDFVSCCFDGLCNQAAKTRYMFGGQAQMPLVVRAPAGSGTGAAGQHSQSPEAWICNMPGLKVVVPSTPYDAKGLTKAAIRDNNAVVIFEQKLLYRIKGDVPEGDYIVPLGQAAIRREGRDVTILTYGRMVARCLEAAEQAMEAGIDVEVIDLRTLVPLDKKSIIASAMKTGRVMIVHEACKTGGFGGELAAVITESEAFNYMDAPILRICGADVPIPYNPKLEASIVPTTPVIFEGIQKLME